MSDKVNENKKIKLILFLLSQLFYVLGIAVAGLVLDNKKDNNAIMILSIIMILIFGYGAIIILTLLVLSFLRCCCYCFNDNFYCSLELSIDSLSVAIFNVVYVSLLLQNLEVSEMASIALIVLNSLSIIMYSCFVKGCCIFTLKVGNEPTG